LEEGISKLEKYKDYHSLGTACMYLAELKLAIGNTEKAEKQPKKSVGYPERAKDVNQRVDSYKKRSELYEASGNLPGAIQYLKRYKNLEDSMALVNNDRKLNDAEFQFQLSQERLQKEKLVLEREKEAYIYKINRALGIIMSLGLLVALVSLLYLLLTRKKPRGANDILEHIEAQRTLEFKEINIEPETFSYRSSHDIRGPLTTMKGLVNLAEITQRTGLPEIFSRLDVMLSALDRRVRKLKVVNEIISSGPL
jgi:signal transduction histidine kinase